MRYDEGNSPKPDPIQGSGGRRRPKRFVSLGTKLTIPVVLLVGVVAIAAHFAAERVSRANAMSSKQAAADMVVKLTSFSIVPAVVFEDELEMNRSVQDLARNPEVLDVELWSTDAGNKGPLASFHRTPGSALGRPDQPTSLRELRSDSLIAVEPVVSQEGATVATLSARFSTAREAAALAALTREFLVYTGVVALGLVLSILFVIRRVIVTPVRRLQDAARSLAQGRQVHFLTAASETTVDDEVIQLTKNFADMAEAVRDREARLSLRNAELKLILDSVHQGFVMARPDGQLLPEHSAVLETWVDKLPAETKVWDLADRLQPGIATLIELNWMQLVEGLLPIEVALGQLPARLTRGQQHFSVDYHPVLTEEVLERVVLVITDVTAQVEHERTVAEQHEFSTLVDQLVRDRRSFAEFWNEANELVNRVTNRENAEQALRRNLHTLKGNARSYGLGRLAMLCHSLEDALQERGGDGLTAAESAQVRELWNSLRARIEPIMREAAAFLEVSENEYRRLVGAAKQHAPHDKLLAIIRSLRDEPTASRLARLRESAVTACRRLGRGMPEVVLEHNDLRLPPGRWSALWAVLPHVVTNAIDHGIESDAERLALNKPLPATLCISTLAGSGEVILEITDDGRGIDWERVRSVAKAQQRPHQSQEDLENALLSEGFSLKTSVSEISGRGVGLAAVRKVIVELGGQIEIESRLGHGTLWRFRCPLGKPDDEHWSTPPARSSARQVPQQRVPAE